MTSGLHLLLAFHIYFIIFSSASFNATNQTLITTIINDTETALEPNAIDNEYDTNILQTIPSNHANSSTTSWNISNILNKEMLSMIIAGLFLYCSIVICLAIFIKRNVENDKKIKAMNMTNMLQIQIEHNINHTNIDDIIIEQEEKHQQIQEIVEEVEDTDNLIIAIKQREFENKMDINKSMDIEMNNDRRRSSLGPLSPITIPGEYIPSPPPPPTSSNYIHPNGHILKTPGY